MGPFRTTNKLHKLPFTHDEVITFLELASEGLSDGERFDDLGEQLDMSDDYLKGLQKRLENYLDQEGVVEDG